MSHPIRLDPFSAKELRIGVVAERTYSTEFVSFLETRINPLLSKEAQSKFSSLRIDDTACNGMRNPEAVAAWIEAARQIYKGRIEIQANQTVSLGMWRPFLPGKPNFIATVSSDKPYQLPLCTEFEGYRCYEGPQGGMSAECRNSHGAIQSLRCLPIQADHFYSDEMGSLQIWSEQNFYWQLDQ